MDIVTTHKNTDFDALASMIAVTLLYPEVTAACPQNVHPNVDRFLRLHKGAFDMVFTKEIDLSAVDRLFVTDTNQWSRLERLEALKNRPDLEILLWDHHHSMPGTIHASRACVEEIGSTTTLLIRELKRNNTSLTPLQATLFLLGIYEDTGQLTYNSTTPEDAYAAGYLLEQGADLDIAGNFLHIAYEENQKQILFQLMRDGELLDMRGLSIAIAVMSLDSRVELATVVQLYREIVNADAVFAIFENGAGNFFVIGRSGTPEIKVNVILSRFGGGGHPGAGAAMIRAGDWTTEQVRQHLLETLEQEQVGVVTVGEMMSYPVISVPPNMIMHDVRDVMDDEGIRGVLIMEGDDLLGILVLSDMKKLRLEKQWQSPVKAFMNKEVKTIGPRLLAGEAAALMVKNKIGHLPVTEDGKVIGIITRTDIITYLYGMLPD